MKSSAIDNLLTSLKRRMAKERNIKGYLDSLDKFCKFAETEPDQIVSDAKKGKVNVVDLLQKFTDHMVNEGLAPKTTRRIYYQVQKFFRANKVRIEVKSVELPISRVIYADRGITKDEIKLLLKTGDLRQRWIVLLMTSSGIRLGSIPYLQLKHLEEWREPSTSNPIMLKIPNEAAKAFQGYTTFITPEAYEALQDYLNLRRKFGEQINEETYLIRDVFAKEPNGASKPKPIKYYGLNSLMQRMMNTYLHTEKKKRHEFKMSHGFRKFFRTVLDSAGVPVGASEAIMGHSAGLIGVYTRHSDEELKKLYARAKQHLTIEKVVASEESVEMALAMLVTQMRGKSESEKRDMLVHFLQRLPSSTRDLFVAKIEEEPQLLGFPMKHVLKVMEKETEPKEKETDCQKVIEEEALEEYLAKGYHFVSVLPSGKIVVED